MKTIPVRLITHDERWLTEAFQEIVRLTLDVFSSADGRGANLAAYKALKKAMKRFSNYPFIQVFSNSFAEWDAELISLFQNKRHGERKKVEIVQASNHLMKLFMSQNIPSAYQYAGEVRQMIDSMKDAPIKVNDVISQKRNPIFIENPLFFGRQGLLKKFEQSEMKELISKNFDEYCWTYMRLPEEKETDFEFIVHWIQQLRNTSDPVALDSSLYSMYSQFAYSSRDFEILQGLVDRYLRNNDRDIIPKILAMLEKIPDLKQTNDDQKKEITKVYRGIPSADLSLDGIEAEDQKRRYVATSISQRVAERFAFGITHLERGRRSEEGVILTYRVTPEAILLVTRIFGGVYGESEVLIDATKAELIDMDVV